MTSRKLHEHTWWPLSPSARLASIAYVRPIGGRRASGAGREFGAAPKVRVMQMSPPRGEVLQRLLPPTAASHAATTPQTIGSA